MTAPVSSWAVRDMLRDVIREIEKQRPYPFDPHAISDLDRLARPVSEWFAAHYAEPIPPRITPYEGEDAWRFMQREQRAWAAFEAGLPGNERQTVAPDAPEPSLIGRLRDLATTHGAMDEEAHKALFARVAKGPPYTDEPAKLNLHPTAETTPCPTVATTQETRVLDILNIDGSVDRYNFPIRDRREHSIPPSYGASYTGTLRDDLGRTVCIVDGKVVSVGKAPAKGGDHE
jgi:hypothetical protein